MSHALLRQIPAVSRLLEDPALRPLVAAHGAGLVTMVLRDRLGRLREALLTGATDRLPSSAEWADAVERTVRRFADPDGRRAINATGILLHTGLGRAPLCDAARAALAGVGRYSVLQTDLATGRRSLREAKVERLLQQLTGCEAATVVNNNAAATMLVLNTLCDGREAIISRGQLVEIGGAFRMPDVMARSGCTMCEIGTTNRTHLRDYAAAISETTGMLVHVHTSNYRVRGFGGTPPVGELAPLAAQHGLPLLDDLGSGALVPLADFGITSEPLVRDSLAAGSDVCCFSGDKLICGPQSGIICGRRELIARIRANPFARMFRVGKLTLAALEATLVHFVNADHAEALPFYRMLAHPLAELQARAEELVERLPPGRAQVEADLSYIGSGSIPDEGIPTRVVCVRTPGVSPTTLARRCREQVPALFARIRDDALVCDLRTVAADELEPLAAGLRAALTD